MYTLVHTDGKCLLPSFLHIMIIFHAHFSAAILLILLARYQMLLPPDDARTLLARQEDEIRQFDMPRFIFNSVSPNIGEYMNTTPLSSR